MQRPLRAAVDDAFDFPDAVHHGVAVCDTVHHPVQLKLADVNAVRFKHAVRDTGHGRFRVPDPDQ